MDEHEATALDYLDRIAAMSDRDVRQAYEATTGTPGDAWADALAEAMKERGIDD